MMVAAVEVPLDLDLQDPHEARPDPKGTDVAAGDQPADRRLRDADTNRDLADSEGAAVGHDKSRAGVVSVIAHA